MSRLAVVCFLWDDRRGRYRGVYQYGVEHVRRLRDMLDRHLSQPHRLVCVTDQGPEDLPDGVSHVSLDMAPQGGRWPKLTAFRPDAAELFGADRLMVTDLDNVVVGPLDPLVERTEPLVLIANDRHGQRHQQRYNTPLMLLDAGAAPEVWETFDPERVPDLSHIAGTDQWWVSHSVNGVATWPWGSESGIYRDPQIKGRLPRDARVVCFQGPRDPSMVSVQRTQPWIKEHWR